MSGTGHDPFSQLLYPMLSAQPAVGDDVILELARAPLEKSAESNRLRLELLGEFGAQIVTAASDMADAFQRGGRLLARDTAEGLREAYEADSIADVYVKAMAS